MVDALHYEPATPPSEPGNDHTDETGNHIPSTNDESPKIENPETPKEYNPTPAPSDDPGKHQQP